MFSRTDTILVYNHCNESAADNYTIRSYMIDQSCKSTSPIDIINQSSNRLDCIVNSKSMFQAKSSI